MNDTKYSISNSLLLQILENIQNYLVLFLVCWIYIYQKKIYIFLNIKTIRNFI